MRTLHGNAAKARQAFSPYMDKQDIDTIEAMDYSDQVYVWESMWYTIRRDLAKDALRDLERAVKAKVGDDVIDSATPFDDADASISAHGWFGRGLRR